MTIRVYLAAIRLGRRIERAGAGRYLPGSWARTMLQCRRAIAQSDKVSSYLSATGWWWATKSNTSRLWAAGETKPLRCCRPLPGRLSAGYPVAAEQTVSRVLGCNESLTAAVSPWSAT